MAKGNVLGIPFLKKCSAFSAHGMEIKLQVGHSGSCRVKKEGKWTKKSKPYRRLIWIFYYYL